MRTALPASARILITGCSSGIGRALADELSARGHHVLATARNVATLEGCTAAERFALDVTSSRSIAALVDATGPVDVVVNNAGLSIWGVVEACDMEAVAAMFDTNVFGAMRVAKAYLPLMRERGHGLILQISSAAGRNVSPMVGWYAATKHALEAASEALRLETAKFGVRVSCISLGAVASALADNRTNFDLPEYAEVTRHFRDRLMSRRSVPTSSEDAARAIADALEDRGGAFRYDVTEDSRAIVASRRATSDADYEASLVKGLMDA
jgi:short-subunit dehydrogenase